MWFDINWNIYALQNLPHKWRDLVSIVFVKVLVRPLNDLYYKWYNWRIDNIYKLEHTNQVCYLRGSLNDKFDPIERRIYIGNGLLYDTQYIFTEAEDSEVIDQKVWLYTEDDLGAEQTIWLRTESETSDTGLDFIVYVPEFVYNNQIEELKAHINFYKAGGKRYDIFIDE